MDKTAKPKDSNDSTKDNKPVTPKGIPIEEVKKVAQEVKKVGKFLNIPYDFRRPTRALIKRRMWNSNDKRIFTPKVFGWGWTINFYQVFRKLRLVK